MNIHKKIIDLIAENITFFGFTIPVLVMSIGIAQTNEIINFTIGLGSCTLFTVPIQISTKALFFIMAATINIITSLSMFYVGFTYRKNPNKRIYFYTKWQKNVSYSLVILAILFLNITCFENNTLSNVLTNILSVDSYQIKITMAILIVVYIAAVILKREANKQFLKTSNKPLEGE